MKNPKYLIILLLLVIYTFVGFTLPKSGDKEECQNDCYPMLSNQHITKRSWIYLHQDDLTVYKKNSDLSEADLLSMNRNSWDATYTDVQTNQKFSSKQKSNASFKFVTLGYNLDDQKKPVGFDFSVLNPQKSADAPYVFSIVNNSQKLPDSQVGTLHEVGFVFDNWPQYWPATKEWTGGEHSFRANYQVEKLDKIVLKFKFKLINYNAPINKSLIKDKWLGSYATCDFRFNEYSQDGKIVNSYLIGVVFSNPLNIDYNGYPNDDILWGSLKTDANHTERRLLLHGNRVGVPEVNKINKDNFQSVEIDFKPLINKFFKINPNNKNIITGLDIYSATRGTDFSYNIKDIELIGCNN